jgi:preprotein translocase subunit SecG
LEGVLLFLHIVVCLLLVIVVLLQSGKSADLAGAFGGYGSQSTFGPRGTATLLSKLTTTLAILFMVTSLLLQVLTAGKSRSGSVLGNEKPVAKTETSQPLKPGSTAPQPQNIPVK